MSIFILEQAKKYTNKRLRESGIKKYGVKFIGSDPVGVRTGDAAGMVAAVGVDDQVVQNDFDSISFYSRPMCNVYHDANGKPHVMAYRGEPGFDLKGAVFPPYADKAEVFYECSPCAWNGSLDEPSVTGTPCEGYELFECFPDWNTKIYLPVYWLSMVDGKAVSRSGTVPKYNSLNGHMTDARTYNANAHTETMVVHMYEYVLQLVEFATRDLQTVMMGACQLSYNADDMATVGELGVNRIILANAIANKYVVGQSIVIGTAKNGADIADRVNITSIEVYDANNKAVYFDGPAKDIAIGKFISSRAWNNGATDIVVASSGSPTSNTSGKYPCIWRGKVDPWADAYSAICDILIERTGEGTSEDPYVYTPHYLPDPTKYSSGAITTDYIKLNLSLPGVDGYAKSLAADKRFRFIGLTDILGASSATYLAAYYYFPRYAICVVFVGGYWDAGRDCSPVCFGCSVASSASYINRLARLSVTRT